ncbi:MAG: 5'/3'-nucleotidase SurE [Chloroflexi bacterium]|nr:MAG: 5'/3'-nucleotidase SurE [Chloroflexota bacterium]
MSNNNEGERPLILFTNDDGIESPGLWAAVGAFADIGELLVVAPREQQSGMGRSMPRHLDGRIHEYPPKIEVPHIRTYAVDASPAQAVQHGVIELAGRKPALVVSGINYGENMGNGVTISGTVGAALEGASLGVPSLAVSQQTPTELHLSYSSDVDFTAAAHFTRKFGLWLIENRNLPDDVDVLKIDVPWGATPDTDWRITRISRRRVYWPTRPERVALGDAGQMGYEYRADPSQAEPNSDVYAVSHDKVVSVSPMSLDMTSRTDLYRLQLILAGRLRYRGENGA